EVSDAVIVVVSEETGSISVAVNGTLQRDFDRETLASYLESMLLDDTKVYIKKKSSLFSSKRKDNDDEKE
ncbi:MAG: DNA integrity scanning protein DisA nucleotide-binding domain protein, partial [Ruminococcus sp.]|nr:DNA integrity scanning protein DisA nucleotide-binding domain protein [Ruminococcus sp.]